ncbi:hypothetical protein Tco_0835226 [Tanacetum coccineum]
MIDTLLTMNLPPTEYTAPEAIHMILSGIRNDIYSTIDACPTAKEIWIAIERLQQGESLNKQDVKTNLIWEFGKFTSIDEESIESYYSRLYKMMNEMIRNKLEVATMQVNVQFLQQLQPEWSRFMTVVKQTLDLDTVSYHKLLDILKQYHNKVNDIRAEKIAMNSNPLDFGHFVKECKKLKWEKDYTYHKEKMMLCKQEKKGVPLNAEQGDCLDDTDEEPDEQELESHYMYMAKIQEVLTANSRPTFDAEPLEQADQNAKEYDEECVVLANLIANLKLDHDENKKIQKQLKKENAALTHELNECKSTLEESNNI